MGVLVEVHSVIVKRQSISDKYFGGWEQFKLNIPNIKTFCFDKNLACIAFMADKDAYHYIHQLEERGLTYLQDEKAIDIVLAHQQGTLSEDCEWADIWSGYIDPEGSQKVTVCEAPQDSCLSFQTPDNWIYEHSLTKNCQSLPGNKRREGIIFLGQENSVDVYFDIKKGKKLYVGRT